METRLTRRAFARSTLRGIVATTAWSTFSSQLSAVEPIPRQGGPRLRLSLAAYSFRDSFKAASSPEAKAAQKRMDLFQFIDYCGQQGCQGAELTSYYFPQPVEAAFLLRLRRHAFLQGIEISGTAVGNTFTTPAGAKRDREIQLVKQWIDYAATLGAPHIRVFAGNADGMTKDEAKKLCISGLEECAAYAAGKGIFLGIENHGGIVAESADLLDIVRTIQSPWVGINLDTGNFHTDDPYRDIALCAPYAVNVQLKGELRKRNAPSEPADLPRLVSILREARYQGYVALEYESAEDPWTAIPPLLKKLSGLLQAA